MKAAMDPRTLELLRALQADEHTAAALDHILQQFREQRRVLAAVDDRATLNELCELLEAWADSAPADLGSLALQEAALSIEEDLEQPLRAIAVLERVLDLEPTTDSLAQLARLYTQRNGEGDRVQAAELYSALGETLGAEGRPWLERALNLVPTHDSALDALEEIVPEGERPQVLRERWAAYLENGGDAKAEAEGRPDAVKSAERRRLELSRAYAAEGSFRDALVFIAPLAERGHTEAARLQEAYLANLEGAVAPARRGKKADSLPPPKHARPARSGATMVGFRLDQYHEALRKDVDQERGSEPEAERESAPDNASASAPASEPPSEDSAVRALPRSGASDAASPDALGASRASTSSLPSTSAPASDSEPAVAAPVRRSLPPPNPAVVRASQPAPRRSSGSSQAASAAAAPSLRPQRHLAAVSKPSPAPRPITAPLPAISASVAPAPAGLIEPAASMPMSAAEVAAPQPETQADPFAAPLPAIAAPAVATAFDDAIPSGKHKPARPVWQYAAGGAVMIALGAFAMMGGDKNADESSASAVSVGATSPSATTATTATTTTTTASAATAAAEPPPVAPVAAAPTPPPVAEEPPAAEPAAPVKKPEPEKTLGTVKTVAKQVRVRGGKITTSKVLSSFEDSLAKIEHCYEEVLEDNPKISGRAILGFTIAKTGKVSAAKLTKSTLKSPALERCTLSAVKGERFAKVKRPAQVTMPLAFSR
jgi:TonB family protein